MHEMSIVMALIEQVGQQLRAHPDARLQTVQLRVGALRQLVPETMTFCFEAATRDTALAGAQLEIEQVPAAVRCRQCAREFTVEENWFACPGCGAMGADLLRGRELELISLELGKAS